MKINKLINIILGIGLFGFSIFMVFWISKTYDFSKLVILLENHHDNPDLWKFLAFIPLLITMFIGALSIINGIIPSKALTIMTTIISGGLIYFILKDLYGFVTISSPYEEKVYLLVYILIGVIVINIIAFISEIIIKNKLKKQKVNI